MFKLLKVSTEVMITALLVGGMLLVYVILEFGTAILIVGVIGTGVYLYSRREKQCGCQLCESVRKQTELNLLKLTLETKEDPRVTEHKQFLRDLDRQGSE